MTTAAVIGEPARIPAGVDQVVHCSGWQILQAYRPDVVIVPHGTPEADHHAALKLGIPTLKMHP